MTRSRTRMGALLSSTTSSSFTAAWRAPGTEPIRDNATADSTRNFSSSPLLITRSARSEAAFSAYFFSPPRATAAYTRSFGSLSFRAARRSSTASLANSPMFLRAAAACRFSSSSPVRSSSRKTTTAALAGSPPTLPSASAALRRTSGSRSFSIAIIGPAVSLSSGPTSLTNVMRTARRSSTSCGFRSGLPFTPFLRPTSSQTFNRRHGPPAPWPCRGHQSH